MSLSKRKDSPHWQYAFTINGQRFRGSTGTDNRSLAEAFVARERTRLYEEINLGRKQRVTLDHAMARYITEHVAHLKTAKKVARQCRLIIEYFGLEMPVAEIDTAQLAGYVAHRRSADIGRKLKHKEMRKVSPSTINREIAAFQHFHTVARDTWGYQVETINFKKVKMQEPDCRVRWESEDSITKLVDAAAPHIRPIILTALYTGMRATPILQLRWCDLRLKTVVFQNVKSKKRGKVHEVPLVDALRDVLDKVHKQQLEWAEKNKVAQPEYIFTYNGQPMSSIKTAWWHATKTAKLDDFRFHDLRHTCASWLVQAGTPIEVVRDILGHADIKTTLKYAHHRQDKKQAEMQRVLSQYRHVME